MRADRLVWRLLARRDFRRLLGTRLACQFGDGVFQAALAGTVLFNPERAADPLAIAAGFAVLLLPYSLVGPFAGVWLDRWSRRQVLVRANLVRAGLVALVAVLIGAGVGDTPLFLGGLAVFSVNRFILSALSAGLPHTTDSRALVSANALSTTSGALTTVVGAGVALGTLRLIGTGEHQYAVLALCAALPYLTASAVASGFGRDHLGPDASCRATADVSTRQILTGMAEGARHAWARPAAAAALTVITVHRFCYGLLTLMTLLLYRNTFADRSGLFPGGMTGLGEVLAAGAVGTFLAALVTPRGVRAIGKPAWITALLAAGAVVQVGLGLPFLPGPALPGGFAMGFVAQGVKICVDTTLQETVDDEYRGRVFSFYDTLFTVAYVSALVAAAVLLPASGVSAPVLLLAGAGYLLAAAAYRTRYRRAAVPTPELSPL